MTQQRTNPIVWTIAGSDSGGGAGIQADLLTINNLGGHGCSAITALTAQNTKSVKAIEAVSASMLESQLAALQADLKPAAIKLGMLHNAASIKIVGDFLKDYDGPIICDPVLVATSGDSLSESDCVKALVSQIIPKCTLLIPNIIEAEKLLNRNPDKLENIKQNPKELSKHIADTAIELLKLGARSVLIKGGHADSAYSQDYWTNGKEHAWLTSPRLPVISSHGTGCTLSAAIATALAISCRGVLHSPAPGEAWPRPYNSFGNTVDLLNAIVIAKAYVNQGLRLGLGRDGNIGSGSMILEHAGWPETQEDLPWLTRAFVSSDRRPRFPNCGDEPIGFYPIVDNVELLERLLLLGVTTAQLRVKPERGAGKAYVGAQQSAPEATIGARPCLARLTKKEIENEIERAVQLARRFNCRLFINDYWDLAIKHNAYGVHLGQEDLESADIGALEQSGLRLGVSAHCYSEVARALAIRPSYIAIGPIFATTTKAMTFTPQGLAGLQRWRKSLDYPLVAIGGISLEHAHDVLAMGADGIAVVRDITQAEDLPSRVSTWLELCKTHATLV